MFSGLTIRIGDVEKTVDAQNGSWLSRSTMLM